MPPQAAHHAGQRRELAPRVPQAGAKRLRRGPYATPRVDNPTEQFRRIGLDQLFDRVLQRDDANIHAEPDQFIDLADDEGFRPAGKQRREVEDLGHGAGRARVWPWLASQPPQRATAADGPRDPTGTPRGPAPGRRRAGRRATPCPRGCQKRWALASSGEYQTKDRAMTRSQASLRSSRPRRRS
jgi:hypothetical protein